MNKAFLAGCRLFQGIDDLAFIESCLHPRIKKCAPGEVIELSVGHHRCFGLVSLGNISSPQDSYSRGDCFGLSYAVTGHSTASYTSRISSTILLFPSDILFSPCSSPCPQRSVFLTNCLTLLAEELEKERFRTDLLRIYTVRGRLCKYLQLLYTQSGSPYFTIPMNRNQLAAYLSVSRPNLSREICKLRDEGILDFQRADIKILKPKELCKP